MISGRHERKRALVTGMVALACLLSGPSAAQNEVKAVTFRAEPDCDVILEIASSEPYVLGQTNRPIPLDLSLFDGRSEVALTFHREGWFDQRRTIQRPGVKSRYFDTYDRYPEPEQGPVVLSPRPDLPSRWLQLREWLGRAWPLVVGLGALGLGAGAAAWGQWRRVRREVTRARQLEGYEASRGKDSRVLTRLGRWRLLEPLGKGGMATVYRAVPDDTRDEAETVAIKVLLPELQEDAESVKRMRREIRILCELDHPNLVRVQDWGEEDGVLYIVMEMLRGKPFHQVLHEQPQGLPLAQVGDFAVAIARGLLHAHEKGIVHRDLKPENLFLCQSGQVKVMDFGIARGRQHTRATGTGIITGTPAYLAPEQLAGGLEVSIDQYALGVVLYEMVTGATPFESDDPFVLAMMHQNNLAPRPGERRPELPQPAETALLQMLRKDPARRFPDVLQAAEAFRAGLTG